MKAPSAVSPSATPGRGFLTAGWGSALVLACAAVVITWAGRDIAPIGGPVGVDPGAVHLDADAIIEDYNGHLLAGDLGRLLRAAPRLRAPQYWVFGATAVALHLAVAALVFVLARRRTGSVPALLPAAAVAFLGTGSDAFLSGLNLGLVAAMAACLAALVMLDRRTPRAAYLCAPAPGPRLLHRRDRVPRPAPASRSFGGTTACGACKVVLVPTVAYGVTAARLRRIALRRCTGEGSGGGTLDVVGNAFEAATGAVAGVAAFSLQALR